jgi:hypothetical protein
MRRPILTIAVIVCLLGAVEATAYWWMHPAPAGLGQPVLVYRPGVVKELSVVRGQSSEKESSENSELAAQSASLASLSTINPQLSTSSLTPLPEVVAAALPSLRCSTGTAARIDRDDGATIHLAFFEWDLADSTNVLEAFKHLPDECMGSIGMTLIEKRAPRSYVVGGQRTGSGGPETADRGAEVGDQRGADAGAQSTSPSSQQNTKNEDQTILRSSSSLSTINSQLSTSSTTLVFDHTVFRDPAGVIIHAFKGTWVSGASNLLGDGLRGGADQWRQIRWKSALKRFRPAHARVAQGAVRGIPNPDFAWEAFEAAMIADLRFQ